MNSREHTLIDTRLKALKAGLSAQMQMKKADRNPAEIEDIKKRISVLSAWLQKPVSKKNSIDQLSESIHQGITKAELDQLVQEHLGDTSKPGFAMEISSKKQVDKLWPWLKRANILVKAPPEIKQYMVAKMKQERKYQV